MIQKIVIFIIIYINYCDPTLVAYQIMSSRAPSYPYPGMVLCPGVVGGIVNGNVVPLNRTGLFSVRSSPLSPLVWLETVKSLTDQQLFELFKTLVVLDIVRMTKSRQNLEDVAPAFQDHYIVNVTFNSRIPDDGMYAKSSFFRENFPRGLAFMLRTSGHDGINNPVVVQTFRGIPKFTGVSKKDDDDLVNSKGEHTPTVYLTGPLEKVHSVTVSEKANGKNAKMGGFFHRGTFYLWAGSKTTAYIMTLESDPQLCGLTPESHSPYPVNSICQLWWNLVNSFDTTTFDNLVHGFKSGEIITIMGELMLPWSQHLTTVSTAHILLFCTIGRNMKSTSASVFERFIGALGVCPQMGEEEQSVMMVKTFNIKSSVKTLGELAGEVRKTYHKDTLLCLSEGSVIYLYDADNNLMGVFKVKTPQYIVQRFLREALRKLLKTITPKSTEAFIRSCSKKKNDASVPGNLKEASDLFGLWVVKNLKNEKTMSFFKSFVDRRDETVDWPAIWGHFMSNLSVVRAEAAVVRAENETTVAALEEHIKSLLRQVKSRDNTGDVRRKLLSELRAANLRLKSFV